MSSVECGVQYRLTHGYSLTPKRKSLTFKTVSSEEEIDFEPYGAFWKYVLAEYPDIFANPNFELRWIDKYTVLLNTKGNDSSLKPGLFVAHMD